MGTIKDFVEDLGFAFDKISTFIVWASFSFAKRMVTLLVVAMIILAGQYLYLNRLLKQAKMSSESRNQEIKYLVRENAYKATLDAITLCIDATKEESSLGDWYCREAVIKYKQASTTWPQDRVKEVSDNLAYGAMKNDVSHYIRNVELERLLHRPPIKENELLDLLLSKTGIGLWVTGALSFFAGIVFVLWRVSLRRVRTQKITKQDEA